jgi:hypothetical protein
MVHYFLTHNKTFPRISHPTTPKPAVSFNSQHNPDEGQISIMQGIKRQSYFLANVQAL